MGKDVKVYTTPVCPFCHRVKSYLDEKGIKYENVNVSSSQSAVDEMVKISGQMGVPVVTVDGEVVVGFDKEQLDRLLG